MSSHARDDETAGSESELEGSYEGEEADLHFLVPFFAMIDVSDVTTVTYRAWLRSSRCRVYGTSV